MLDLSKYRFEGDDREERRTNVHEAHKFLTNCKVIVTLQMVKVLSDHLENSLDHKDLLARVASLYYDQELTQADVARRVGVSRSKISRLLKEARKEGIVEIVINYPWRTASALEQEIQDRFEIPHVSVLVSQGRSYEEILRGLGNLAARYLESILEPGVILGISWGTAIYQTARSLRPELRLAIKVIQMIGAVGSSDPLIDGPDLARFLANLYGGEYRYLHVPLIVDDASLVEGLMRESHVQHTLELARKSDIAVVGIGGVAPEVSSFLRAGFLSRSDLKQLEDQGAAGDICGRLYDIRGEKLNLPVDKRIIGIELDDLRKIKHVVGVAGGEQKAKAILGALRGKRVTALVTDDMAARRVLRMDSEL